MAHSYRRIKISPIRVVRIEPDSLLDVWNPRLWLAHIQERVAKLVERSRVVAVEGYCRLELDLRFGQSVLNPAQHAHRIMRPRTVRIALESFKKQLLGSRLILLNRAAPPIADIRSQDQGDANPRIDGSRVNAQ